ncbi:hypothetical protein OCU04_008742 [Sclerotinia nivalis]|uniref:Uncharacterized protein n=1 Tax=Sclerotinia nivalis TaxID=352851 RepID=A0A9X0AJN0_9HELO|nr:hypothetical protein OCU04_008742 [Sclerotinia nivalis]
MPQALDLRHANDLTVKDWNLLIGWNPYLQKEHLGKMNDQRLYLWRMKTFLSIQFVPVEQVEERITEYFNIMGLSFPALTDTLCQIVRARFPSLVMASLGHHHLDSDKTMIEICVTAKVFVRTMPPPEYDGTNLQITDLCPLTQYVISMA